MKFQKTFFDNLDENNIDFIKILIEIGEINLSSLKILLKQTAKYVKKLLKQGILPILEFNLTNSLKDLTELPKTLSLLILELNLLEIPLECVFLSFLLDSRENKSEYDKYLIEFITKLKTSLVPAIQGIFVFFK